MPFTPPVGFVGVTVYAPPPNPFSVYCPAVAPGSAVVVMTVGDPAPVIVTFEINFGGVVAFGYVTVPEIDPAAAGTKFNPTLSLKFPPGERSLQAAGGIGAAT